MTIKVKTILHNAARALQDEKRYARWSLEELMDYLNDGLRALVRLMPGTFTEDRTLNLEAGPRQEVTGVYSILDIASNMVGATPARVVRSCSRESLDLSDAGWQMATPNAEVRNAALDPVQKNCFWVYPPNDGTGTVRARVVLLPQVIELTASTGTIDDYDVELPVDEAYAAALTFYVLSRAWDKDADFAANQANSNEYRARFLSELGVTEGAE